MGAACGGCFDGAKKSLPAPDASPGTRTRRAYNKGTPVTTQAEALEVSRVRAGSWTSPKAVPWATPVPMSMLSPGQLQSKGAECDFDMIIEDPSSQRTPGGSALMMDTDGSNRRPETLQNFSHRSKFEVEQLLASPGSLPAPMTREARERHIRTMLPTATYDMLAKIDKSLVCAEGPEAQALRRKLAHGATVVFFTAGYPGKRFIFERAAQLGIKSVIVEHPDSWSRCLVDEGIVAKFCPIDMGQSSEVIYKQTVELMKTLSQDGIVGEPDAICTFVELSVPIVARLCEELGLPGLTPDAVDKARNKHETRAAMKLAGLPTPANALIHNEAEVKAAGEHVGFPAVLKPISGAASLGVKKVEGMDELLNSYREVAAELSSLVVASGALVKNDGSGTGVAAEKVVDMTVLLEQYLDGPEVDIDVVMSEGEWRYAGVADNGPTLEPYFNETWAVCPSVLPKEHQMQLKMLAIDSVKALGFDCGVFHVECKMTSRGPQLIEVNARMGGGQVHECNLRTWGVDLVEETLFIALGIPSRPVVPKVPHACVAYCYVNAVTSGRIQSLDFLEELRANPDVIWAKYLVKADSEVVGPADGMPTWLADILVNKKTSKEAIDFLLKAQEGLKVNVK